MENRFHPVIARPQGRSNPEQMTGSSRTLRVLAMTLLLFCASLPAAAQVPGDACATAQQYKVNAGPETLGVVHMMVCEGGTWKSIVSSNAAGEVTQIGNQICANNDYLKYDGTKFICTPGTGGAALSGILAATGGNSINSGDHAQVWNWQLTTADKDAFTFTENIASTATGNSSILKAATLGTSTATPFMITNLGAANSFVVNDETGDADTTPFVIAADGNVGIGTASPESKLHLAENLPAPGIATMRINNTANQSSSAIVFEESNQGDNFTIRYNTDSAMLGGNENYLEFLANGVTPVMILDRGNPVYGVGVGTPIGYPPAAKLEVRNSGTEDILNLYDSATEVLTVLDGGNVGIRETSPVYSLEIASNVEDGIIITQAAATDNQNPFIEMRRSKGTVAAPVLVDLDTKLGELAANGYNGSSYLNAALIAAVVDGTVTSGAADMPTRLEFNVQADGAGAWMGDGASVPELVIKSTGNIGIGTATPAHKLTVSGDFADDGILIENIRATDLDSGNLDFRRARGTSATPLVPTSGDELAHITFQGYAGGGTYTTAADIIATLDGTSSGGGDMPGLLTFRTRADGAGSISTRMVIDNSGSVGIGVSTPPSKFVVAPPASAAVAGGGTITADACGTIKQITSTGNVTTNTTNTFTAPTASYAGCCMTVINVDTADTITLDANTLFKTIGGANQALGPSDAVEVCSNGTNWYQIGAVSANQ